MIDNNGNGFIQEFGSVDGSADLNGFFDFRVTGSEGELLFFPDNFDTNNYDVHGLVYNVDRDIHTAVGISTLVGITTVGDIVQLATRGSKINAGVTTTVNIYDIPLTNMDAGHKFMIQMTAGELHEVVNLNVLHDDTYGYDLQYGDMSNIDPSSTTVYHRRYLYFSSYVENNIYYINATPAAGVTGTGITFNIFGQCFIGGISTVGIATVELTTGDIRASIKASLPQRHRYHNCCNLW